MSESLFERKERALLYELEKEPIVTEMVLQDHTAMRRLHLSCASAYDRLYPFTVRDQLCICISLCIP